MPVADANGSLLGTLMRDAANEPSADSMTHIGAAAEAAARWIDEVDLLRAREYELIAILLHRAPNPEFLSRLARLEGDGSTLGQAHRDLAEAARGPTADTLQREFFDLFIGVARGELLPYASYYLTGFLNEVPLARVRDDLDAIGIERADDEPEPEDHIAILFEIMAGLAGGRFPAEPGADRRFFERHLKPWAGRFFEDLENCRSAEFYRAVGTLGRLFMAIEAEASAMD
jgi:TorA maturation chaperone TorD